MSVEELDVLSRVVPQVPEILLDNCAESSRLMRDELLIAMRQSTLVPLIQSKSYPATIMPPREELFNTLHLPVVDGISALRPQEVQGIALIVEFVQKNSICLARALQDKFAKHQKDDFIFMCCSAIPSFFGFFSSSEHMAAAIPFYCTLVGMAEYSMVNHALLPFFCNAATFRYIEMIYDKFGAEFCHDDRLNTTKIQKSLLLDYVKPLIKAIEHAFPLLPQPHQFLLRFMKTRGWGSNAVLSFFLHEFTLPQLLRYVRSGPFQMHFQQMKHMFISLKSNMELFHPLLKVFEAKSFFEVPSAFTVFAAPFSQYVMTTADVCVIVQALESSNEVPQTLKPFMNSLPPKRDFSPFWIRVYSRVTVDVDTSYNWRQVVFSSVPVKPPEDADMQRIWLQLKSIYEENQIKPLELLRGEGKTPTHVFRREQIKLLLGSRLDAFVEYAVQRELAELKVRSQVFERYLVHLLALKTLSIWKAVVDEYYSMMIIPHFQLRMEAAVANQTLNTMSPADFVMSLVGSIPVNEIRRICYMMTIETVLRDVVASSSGKKLKFLEQQWKVHMEQVREHLELPSAFKNTLTNARRALHLNQKLWAAVEGLKCIEKVKFSWSLKIIFGALAQLDELIRVDDSESTVIQFTLAFSESPLFISRFLLINVFVMKQKFFHKLTGHTQDMLLWSRLESAVLKLLKRNEKILLYFLSVQDEFAQYEIVCK